jgi:hypothetical protein
VKSKLPHVTTYRRKAMECRGLAAIAPKRLKSKFIRLAEIYESLAADAAPDRTNARKSPHKTEQGDAL